MGVIKVRLHPSHEEWIRSRGLSVEDFVAQAVHTLIQRKKLEEAGSGS